MNEHAKALMGEVLDQEFSHTWTALTYADLEKFSAKLIELTVQECATVAKIKALSIVEKAGEFAADDDEFDAAKAVAWQFKVFAQEITEHFGVEE